MGDAELLLTMCRAEVIAAVNMMAGVLTPLNIVIDPPQRRNMLGALYVCFCYREPSSSVRGVSPLSLSMMLLHHRISRAPRFLTRMIFQKVQKLVVLVDDLRAAIDMQSDLLGEIHHHQLK